MKIFEVDFQNKKLHFTFDDNSKEINEKHFNDLKETLIKAYNLVTKITPDCEYQEHCNRVLSDILYRLKEQ